MYPGKFDYYEASSVSETLRLLEEHDNEDPELLAGGHSLLPAMKTGLSSPEVLIDIGDIDELHGISVEDGHLVVGAATRYSEFLEYEKASEQAPAFAAAVGKVGDRQVRNRGTVGGNLAHADPASDLPGAALASGATMLLQGQDGKREVPADEFFLGFYRTDVGDRELLTQVQIPADADATGSYAKKPSPSSGYAMVGVAARLRTDGDSVTSARLGANGVLGQAVRLEPVEDVLEGEPLTNKLIDTAAEHATDDLDVSRMLDDLQASNEFRAQLLKVYTERALQNLLETN